MSDTNAISGIILVGGILQIGHTNPLVTTVAVVAVLVASINVFGGFLVTLRMLDMFRKG
jgi:H+-translocating NAD(P) transhydrogenase subunit alpha